MTTFTVKIPTEWTRMRSRSKQPRMVTVVTKWTTAEYRLQPSAPSAVPGDVRFDNGKIGEVVW